MWALNLLGSHRPSRGHREAEPQKALEPLFNTWALESLHVDEGCENREVKSHA